MPTAAATAPRLVPSAAIAGMVPDARGAARRARRSRLLTVIELNLDQGNGFAITGFARRKRVSYGAVPGAFGDATDAPAKAAAGRIILPASS